MEVAIALSSLHLGSLLLAIAALAYGIFLRRACAGRSVDATRCLFCGYPRPASRPLPHQCSECGAVTDEKALRKARDRVRWQAFMGIVFILMGITYIAYFALLSWR